MVPWYTATEQFSPAAKPADWRAYVAASGLDQLEEVVSLDMLLCPPILREVKAEYWPHIVNEDFMPQFFTDLEFMLGQVRSVKSKNVLCVFRNPERAPSQPRNGTWEFVGYDLVDVYGGNSALTNCGGFLKAFANAELSSKGLLLSLERASEVQQALRTHYTEEPHANCHIWAVFRANEL
jgi:hypothetical protein